MKTCKKLYHLSKAVAVISLFVVVLVGCGQWSGGAGAPSSTTVSGVAAAGSPISGNAYLKDSANHEIGPVPIGADGSFSFDVAGLTPPFYLFAVGNVGSISYKLYSVTTSSSGIANINPLTNVIVAAAAGGIDPASTYDNPSAHPVTKSDIDKAITGLQTMLASLLTQYDAEHIDPISDSFTADHTKLDKVFDIIAITVDSSGGGVPVVSVTDITGEVIAGGSTGDLEHPTTSLDPANIPKDVLSIGADRLVATQNNDGGWDWPNPDNDSIFPTQTSPVNTIGVTAQGLLDAYKITKNNSYLTACIKAYNLLLSNSTNTVLWYNYPRNKIRGADITFLVELSEVTGNSKYAAFAKNWYKATLHDFGGSTRSAVGLAGSIRDVRKSQNLPALISWDINLYIQGVLALDRYYKGQGFDFDTDAKSMAEVIYNSFYVATLFFDPSNTAQTDVWLGYTGAIEAFTTTGLHRVQRDSLMTTLISNQQGAGNFVGINDPADVQTTAYAVMALLKAGGNDANVAAKKGVKYLVNRQPANGIWLETDNIEYTESESEAIQAIYNFKTPSSSTTAVTVGPSGDHLTIQAAIDAAAPGDTIKVSAGTYDETINITKRVAIIGAGSGDTGTVLINTAVQGDFVNLPNVAGVTYGGYRPNVIVSASGIDGNNPVLLKDLQIKPGPNNGYPRPGILLQPGVGPGYIASYSYVELNNVRVIGDLSHDSPGQAAPHVLPVSTNARGITIDGSTSLQHFVVKNCEFSDMTYGMIFYNNAAHPSTVQDVEITNTTFARNAVKGFYAEKLSDATFTNVTVTDNGNIARSPYYWAWNNAGIDITLLYGNYKNLVFNNLTVTGNGIDSYAGAGLTVKARGTGNDEALLLANPAALDGVMVSGGTFTGNTVGIRFGEVASPPPPTYSNPPAQSLQNTSPTNITVRGANVSGNTAGDIVNYLNGVTIHN